LCRAFETSTTLITKDKIASTVHRVTTTFLLNPKLALWALLQAIRLCKRLKLLVIFAPFLLVLEFLAGDARMPSCLADHAIALATQWANQLIVLRIPFELKIASGRWTATHVFHSIDESAEIQPQVAIAIRFRLEARQHILLVQRLSTFLLGFLIAQIGARHLNFINFSIACLCLYILSETLLTKAVQARL
jgi:hypothetical protein